MNRVLHVYGQRYWHDDVLILGDAEALQKLAATILQVLAGKPYRGRSIDVYAGDGEGYSVTVAYLDDQNALENLAVPYTHPDAAERREDALWPEVIPAEEKQVILLRRQEARRRWS